MIRTLVDFALRRKVTTSMIVLILCIVGILSLKRLDEDFMPDIEMPSVSVVTAYPGAPPEEIENTITRPIEQAANRVRRARKVRSVSSEGVSVVTVEFDWNTPLDFAAQEVRDRIGQARGTFPAGATDPLVIKFNLSDFPIMMGGITSDDPVLELKRKVEQDIVPRLNRVDGVAAVVVSARESREILVEFDKDALDARGLLVEQIVLALRAANLNVPAGRLIEGSREVLVRAIGEFRALDDIRKTVVGLTSASRPVFLEDVAQVVDGVKETGLVYRTDGRKGLLFTVQKRSGANTVRTARALRTEIARIEATSAGHLRFYPRFDEGEIIEDVLKETRSDGGFGALLAVLLIFVFLRSARSTLIVALAIPFSVLTTFTALLAAGASINLMTLGGLALGAGMLVDNAIVVVENIHRLREEGHGKFEAARRGAIEVGPAIAVGTLTNIIVFLPLLFTSGLTGRLTTALAMSISFSLLASLVIALTFVPLAAALLMKDVPDRRRESSPDRGSVWFESMRNAYRRSLDRALRHRALVLGGTGLLIAAAAALIPGLGKEFVPAMDSDWLMFTLRLPVGTAASETDRVAGLVEKTIAAEKGVKSVSVQVGSQAEISPQDLAGAFSTSGPNEGMIMVGLEPGKRRTVSGARIVENVRNRLPRLDGVEFNSVDIIRQVMFEDRAAVEIVIRGEDLKTLTDTAERIVGRLRAVPGLRDVTHSMTARRPEIHIRPDRATLALLGIQTGQVGSAVRSATLGLVATRFRDDSDEVDIRVRGKKASLAAPENLREVAVPNPARLRAAADLSRSLSSTGPDSVLASGSGPESGIRGGAGIPPATFRLDQIAAIEKGLGPIRILRENLSRQVTVRANLSGRDLGGAVRDIRPVLDEFAAGLPPGAAIAVGGQFEEMRETLKIMLGAILLAVLLMFMLIAAEFESFLHPLIIMAAVPLGFIGVVIGVFLFGKTISLPVLLGFIILEGIADNNAIVMVECVNRLKGRGIGKREAIIEGSVIRLRPVLITALTTVLGVLPMAFRAGAGTELRSPMAVAILGGLVATTFLTLFLIPVLLSYSERIGPRRRKG